MKSLAGIRKGQWARLAGVAICLLAMILFITLPQITIEYTKYSQSSVAGARDYLFPPELISGPSNLFGTGYFCFYQKSLLGPEVLTTKKLSFNGYAFTTLVIAFVACILDVWLTFTKKFEKLSKLTTLLFVISGLMCFMGPIFFLRTNAIGPANVSTLDNFYNYWKYDSLYVHDAYGAITAGLVFILAGIAFGFGTSLEGGKEDDNRNSED